MDDKPTDAAALADETNDILTQMLLAAESQEKHLKAIRRWVTFMGIVTLLVWISVNIAAFQIVNGL